MHARPPHGSPERYPQFLPAAPSISGMFNFGLLAVYTFLLKLSSTKVIDEADRLLAQPFQDWLARVLSAIRTSPLPPSANFSLHHPDALSPSSQPLFNTDIDEKKEVSCQKMLFSATLTWNPAQIAALELRNPKYFVVQSPDHEKQVGIFGVIADKFTFPASLTVRFCSS